MSEVVMQCDGVSLEYRTRQGFLSSFTHQALTNISFTIAKGEVFGVLGGNGSGKSSLLKILAGVIPPSSGRFVCKPKLTRALLALGLGFNNELTGRENVLLSAMIQGKSKRQAREIITKVEQFIELDEFFDRPVKSYSSGMRSKLGFATSVYCDVDILLIDETLSVGDSRFKGKAEQAMLDIIHHQGKTIVFVSHSANQIKRICSRCAWIDKGQLQAIGDTQSVIDAYNASNQ